VSRGALLEFEPAYLSGYITLWSDHAKGPTRVSAKTSEWTASTMESSAPASQVLKQWTASPPTYVKGLLAIYFAIQVLLPLRAYAYPGPLAWGEEGYRFGWRVMLVEKVGQATFTVIDEENERQTVINNADYLTPYQEKQMAIQPDFMLQFAHHLADEFEREKGYKSPAVYVDARVALNGRRSRQLIDPRVDLASQEDGLLPKSWILPFE
jgi:hypothetical protein